MLKDVINNNIFINNVTTNDYGINIEGSINNTISKNNVNDNVNEGIYLHNSIKNIITDNNAHNNKYRGARLEFSDNNTFSDNNISISHDNKNPKMNEGISFMFSYNNILRNNSILGYWLNFEDDGKNNISTSNLVDGKPIYYLTEAYDEVINSYSKAGTVYCINCRNITVKNLNLTNNSCGIFFLRNYKLDNSRQQSP